MRSGVARIAASLIALFQLGRFLPSSVDAVHTYATEVHDYGEQIPKDVMELIYFLDEDLGTVLQPLARACSLLSVPSLVHTLS